MFCIVEITMNYIDHFQWGFLYLKKPLLIKLRLGTAYVARLIHTVNIYFFPFFSAFFASNCLHGQRREKDLFRLFLCCRSERLHHRNTFLFSERSAYSYKKLIDIMFCSAEKAPRCHGSRVNRGILFQFESTCKISFTIAVYRCYICKSTSSSGQFILRLLFLAPTHPAFVMLLPSSWNGTFYFFVCIFYLLRVASEEAFDWIDVNVFVIVVRFFLSAGLIVSTSGERKHTSMREIRKLGKAFGIY